MVFFYDLILLRINQAPFHSIFPSFLTFFKIIPSFVRNTFLFVSNRVMSLSIENIIQKHSPSLFKICLGYSKSVEEAEDTLQEVLINVWKGLARFREDSNIKTWLYRITVNTCLLKLRKKTIKTISLTELDDSWFTFEPPSNAVQESFEQLHQFIQGLPVKDKSIILLYLEELSHQEIASIVGITPNYVGVKINRIKQTLSNKMKCHG